MSEKIDIKSLNFEQLSVSLKEYGVQGYRVKQIYKWLQQKGVSSFDEMSDISKSLRSLLADNYIIKDCVPAKTLVSSIDETRKYLFRLYDGEFIESVLMKYKYGYTICISTQVGCKMGCKFCASTINGCVRNLAPSEMLSQVHAAMKDANVRISHIVLMGMGEPLDNFENVLKFIELITDENSLNLSARNITLSTCGIVPKIYELKDRSLPITLSVSLHAPNDEIRNRTMPVNKRWGVGELLKACKTYADSTSRRVSFEYAMISGVNDSVECAEELGQKLQGILCHVNLIPVNSVKENSFKKSSDSTIKKFIDVLQTYKINVTVRRTLGSDINASCGQLRRANKK